MWNDITALFLTILAGIVVIVVLAAFIAGSLL